LEQHKNGVGGSGEKKAGITQGGSEGCTEKDVLFVRVFGQQTSLHL